MEQRRLVRPRRLQTSPNQARLAHPFLASGGDEGATSKRYTQ